MPEFIVALLLLIALAFQVVHLALLAGAQLGDENISEQPLERVPVSVIICAKNEAAQLAARLPKILAQDYSKAGLPAFEVIVADDASTDETKALIICLQADFPQLRYRYVLPAEKPFGGKKGALVVAVAEAQNDLLLFTDADCAPASPHWISLMTACLSASKDLVAGYAPYEAQSGFLNAFIRAEALFGFLHIVALHRWGVAYMATGRNLLVRKAAFRAAAAHPLWTKTLSGDDDMLVRLTATRKNFAVQPSPEAAMHSPAKATLRQYIAQKQRHMSTGKYYRTGIKILFFLLNGSSFLFWAVLPAALLLLFAGRTSPLLLGALSGAFFRIGLFALLLYKSARRQGEQVPFLFFPLFDAGTALHSLFFAPYIFWKNKTTWK